MTAEIALRAPIIGLGASAATYYPGVADAVSGTLVCPEHAEVANAVGAVAGRVRVVLEETAGIKGGKYSPALLGRADAIQAAGVEPFEDVAFLAVFR